MYLLYINSIENTIFFIAKYCIYYNSLLYVVYLSYIRTAIANLYQPTLSCYTILSKKTSAPYIALYSLRYYSTIINGRSFRQSTCTATPYNSDSTASVSISRLGPFSTTCPSATIATCVTGGIISSIWCVT